MVTVGLFRHLIHVQIGRLLNIPIECHPVFE